MRIKCVGGLVMKNLECAKNGEPVSFQMLMEYGAHHPCWLGLMGSQQHLEGHRRYPIPKLPLELLPFSFV